MPIYEYRCDECGHALEAIQKFSDAPLEDCPDCGAVALRKQISAAAFHLKGTGWYKTDFKGNGKTKPADASEKESTSSGDGKEAGAKDSKSDGKKLEEKTSTSTSKKSESNSTASAD